MTEDGGAQPGVASRVRPRWLDAALAWARRSGPGALVEAAVNFGLPFLVYTLAKPRLGDVHALMAASAPPIAWSIAEFVRRRRIDAFSLLVLAGIALSLIAFLGGGGVRMLQLREHLVGAVIGLVFLGSAAIGRPLIYVLARARMRRASPDQAQAFEALRHNPHFRRSMMLMTLVWGVGLTAEAATACALVFMLSIPEFLVVSPIIGYAATGALAAWTVWYARRRAAMRVAETTPAG